MSVVKFFVEIIDFMEMSDEVLCSLQNLRRAKSMLIHDCADMGDMCKKLMR